MAFDTHTNLAYSTVQAGGATVIVHGHNDITQDYKTNIANVATVQQTIAQAAWKNALRFCISKARANNMFGSSIASASTNIQWDTNLSASGGGFGGTQWSNVAITTNISNYFDSQNRIYVRVYQVVV